MKKQFLSILTIGVFIVGLAACGGSAHKEAEHSDEAHNEMKHDDHKGHDMDHSKDADGSELLAIPEGASVSFGNLEDGQTISMPFTVMFEVEGMEIEPAGKLSEGMGHHHLIINGGAIERGTVVPADSLNIHYGQGQTETELDLAAGEYTLTMQFADGYHQSYGEQMSATVNVIVE